MKTLDEYLKRKIEIIEQLNAAAGEERRSLLREGERISLRIDTLTRIQETGATPTGETEEAAAEE